MSYNNAAEFIYANIDSAITGYQKKLGYGLDYSEFIKSSGGTFKKVFVNLESIRVNTEYEDNIAETMLINTVIYLRNDNDADAYTDLSAIITYFSSSIYADATGHKTQVIFSEAIPARVDGRDIWEIRFHEYRGLI